MPTKGGAALQGAVTTITEPGTESLTYCFAIGFGGIAQLLAGLLEARRGKIFGAVVFSSYGAISAFWQTTPSAPCPLGTCIALRTMAAAHEIGDSSTSCLQL